ncbi:neurensin-1-like [Branchiostoma floridae x Branchiostoma japonicum]
MAEDTDGPSSSSSYSCPPQFGVRSYLHRFYEDCAGYGGPDPSNPHDNPYISDDFRYLINPKPKRSTYIFCKLAMVCGLSLLAFGVVAILIGYLIPQRPELVGYLGGVPVVDSSASDLNDKLDACKLTGLILLCLGGVTVAISLLVPSFLLGYMQKEMLLQEDFKDRIAGDPLLVGPGGYGTVGTTPPVSGSGSGIPVTEQVKSVQPGAQDPKPAPTPAGEEDNLLDH